MSQLIKYLISNFNWNRNNSDNKKAIAKSKNSGTSVSFNGDGNKITFGPDNKDQHISIIKAALLDLDYNSRSRRHNSFKYLNVEGVLRLHGVNELSKALQDNLKDYLDLVGSYNNNFTFSGHQVQSQSKMLIERLKEQLNFVTN